MSRSAKRSQRNRRSQNRKPTRRHNASASSYVSLQFESLENRCLLAAAFSEFIDPNPATGNQFGATVLPLITGNVVITAPGDDAAGANAGAVYLFNGATGALISTLRGASPGDSIGSSGVTALANGNYVIASSQWDYFGAVDAGAITFGRGTTGVSGFVSSANSLVGTQAFQPIGTSITALKNGSYVVGSPNWDVLGRIDAGAATYGNGTTGISGFISTGNSLYGSYDFDRVGGNVIALDNAAGHYVVNSPSFATNRGAVTFGSGSGTTTGNLNSGNSVFGSLIGDRVGIGVTALPGGKYVIVSSNWNGSRGAVTLAPATGIMGTVTTSNSLVGSAPGHFVGSGGVTALAGSASGHYVVKSPGWDNGGITDAGAVTFVSGSSGLIASVSTGNSLFGTAANDRVGSGGIVALASGRFVVASPEWNGTRGAVTLRFASGSPAAVSTSNSLYGNLSGDRIGSGGVVGLTTSHFVVSSPEWDNSSIVDAGAVTFVNSSSSGLIAPVSTGNSLFGTLAGDKVGNGGVTALTTGRYVVASPLWNGTRGAATLGSSSGINGAVTTGNSLFGSSVGDQVASGGVTALSIAAGHYVVLSPNWDNGALVNAGGATFGNGSFGITGPVTAFNSLVGLTAHDLVGSGGATALSNGNYAINSPTWDNQGVVVNAGAVTFANGTIGITGGITTTNSVIGLTGGTSLGSTVVNDAHDHLYGRFRTESVGGRVRVGSQMDGFGVPNSAPTITVNLAAVTADEGGAINNAGTFFDADGISTVTLNANIGTVTQNNSNGAWSWSLNAADGPSGPFTVIIDARDSQYGAVATFTYAVDNVPPTISLSGNATVDEGSTYSLNLGNIYDPGEDLITSYTINWGDGTSNTISGNPANTIATHIYRDGPDNLTHAVSVTDEDGSFIAGSLSVQVLNVAPSIELSGNGSVDEGTEYRLNLGAIYDPGDDAIYEYSINWGDGNITGPITGNPGASVATHTYADGSNFYQILVSLTDEDGVFDSAGMYFVTVNNVAPTIELSGEPSVDEGSLYTLNLGALVETGADSITDYSIDWGDGEVDSFLGNPANSVVTHTYADGGNNHTIRITAYDEDGTHFAGFHDISVTNITPTISLSGNANIDEGSAHTLNLGTLVDPGDDTVSEYSIDWGDGQVETFSGSPANTTADHTYADGENDYMISVSVTDEDGIHDVGSHNVHVNNVSPAISFGGPASVTEGSPYALNFGGPVDPGTDTITDYSIDWGDGQVDTFSGSPAYTTTYHYYADGENDFTIIVSLTDEDGTYDAGSQDVHVYNVAPSGSITGALSVVEGSIFTLFISKKFGDSGDDTVTEYSIDWGDGHVDNFIGNPANTTATHVYADGPNDFKILLSVTDEDGTFAIASHKMQVENVIPTLALNGDVVVNEGALYSLNLGEITDPGDDTIFEYSIDWGDGNVSSFTGDPSNTVATHTYTDGLVNALIRVFGRDEDAAKDYLLGSHSVLVKNVAPTISLSGDAEVDEGSIFTLNLGALVDPGDDTVIEGTIVWGDGYQSDFTGNPANTTANHTYADGANNYTISVIIKDEDGKHTGGSHDVQVNNVAPGISVSGDSEVDEGAVFTLNLGAVSDPGDDTVSEYSIDWGDGDVSTFSGDPSNTFATHIYTDGPNSYQIVVSLTDEDGVVENAATHVVALIVSNTAPATPVDNDGAPNEVMENSANGTAVGITAFSSDPDNDSVTYSLVDDAGGRFAIDTDSGMVTVANGALLDFESATSYAITIRASDGLAYSMTQDFTINLLNQTAVISGTVFVDVDGDGLFDGGTETALDGVMIELLNGDGNLLETDETELGGVYAFIVNDEFGTYRIRETQPSGVTSLAAVLGSFGGSMISSNEMQLTLDGDHGSDYDFTEAGQNVQSGDTATIGFWQNKNGQALIKQGGPALAVWLSSNFGNVFGKTFSNGSGGDDANEVASFYKNEFFNKKLQGTSKVDAQFMATALATFFTSSNLSGGSVAANFGFNVTETGIGTKVINVGASGAAFDVANNTNMTIMALLLATNNLTGADSDNNGSEDYSNVYDTNGDGVLDAAEKALRAMANNIYTLINEAGDI